MLQYIDKGHQGKERCLLRGRNTVFWPKMTYNVQQLIEKCIICQYCITIATTDTLHTKGEKAAPTSKHSRHPRNVPNLTGTHEETRETTRKKLH